MKQNINTNKKDYAIVIAFYVFTVFGSFIVVT